MIDVAKPTMTISILSTTLYCYIPILFYLAKINHRKKIQDNILNNEMISSLMKKLLIIGILVTIIVIISAVIIIQLQERGIPSGWTYNSELSEQYVDEEYGGVIPPCGCSYEIFVNDDLVPPEPPFPIGSRYIRLYICYQLETPDRCDLDKKGVYQDGEFVWEDGI